MDNLFEAIYKYDIYQLNKLLEQKKYQNDDLHLALNLSIQYGDPDIMDVLLKYGADPYFNKTTHGTCLHTAMHVQNMDMIVELLKRNINPNIKDKWGNTPLHESDNLLVSTKLLEYKADPNIKNTDGETPLYSAIRRHDEFIVKVLLKYGADISITNDKNQSPLDFAEEAFFNIKYDIFYQSSENIVNLLKGIIEAPIIKEPE